MKKVFVVFLALLLCFSLTACKSLEDKREEAVAYAETVAKEEGNKTPQYEIATYYEPAEEAFVVFVASSKQYYTDYIEKQYSKESEERKKLLVAAMMRVMENNNGSEIESVMANVGNAVKDDLAKVELRTIVVYVDLDEEVKYRIEL